jgi:hypothetical protein
MNQQFHPSFGSFIGSVVFAASPALVVATVHYFMDLHPGVLIWIGSGLMLSMSFALFLQAIFVHLVRLEISAIGIRTFGGLSAAQAIRWSDVTEATLRERHNPVSRTDRLVILRSRSSMMNYPVSILSHSDELKVVEELNRRTKLVVIQDRPAI